MTTGQPIWDVNLYNMTKLCSPEWHLFYPAINNREKTVIGFVWKNKGSILSS